MRGVNFFGFLIYLRSIKADLWYLSYTNFPKKEQNLSKKSVRTLEK